MKKVNELNFHKVNLPADMKAVVDIYIKKDEYAMYQGISHKGLFKYVKHQHKIRTENEDLLTISHLMNEAIELLALSIDRDSQVVDTIHYIISEDESLVIIYLQMKDDEVSYSNMPKFIGRKFSNIEALRRLLTNLSGQYNIKTGLFL